MDLRELDAYGYTGESYGDSTELLYLRSRYYASGTGRFLTRDTWGGDENRPLSLNRWNYANANPINFVDPSGYFSDSVIQYSLGGQTLSQSFGLKRSGVARWGLYALLKDADAWDQFTLRTANFGYDGPNYPLKPDNDGSWMVYNHGCQLVFLNPRWGYLSLPDFLRVINHKVEVNTALSEKWWRPSSEQYHWYESNNKFYSDYYEWTDMPQIIITSYAPILEIGSVAHIRDMYGNQYYSASAGFPFGVSLAEGWEGYPSFNAPISQRSWRRLNEGEIKNIVLGWSITGNGSVLVAGAGFSLWRTGTIALFGGYNASFGGSLSLGYTWEASTKDYFHAWDWIDDISRYGPP